MDEFAIDAVASCTGVFSSLAITSNDLPQSSVEAWGTAMAAASSKRSAVLQSQLSRANALTTDKTKIPIRDHNVRRSRIHRGLGMLQSGVGVLEVVGGVRGGFLASEIGVGAVPRGVIGVDDIQAGVRQAWTRNAHF